MGYRVVVTEGPVDTEIASLAGSSSVVGDPPQWSDDSDATYGRITTWSSGTSAVTAVNGCTVDLKVGSYAVPTGARVRVRLGAEQSDVPLPSKIHVYNWFTGVDSLTVAPASSIAPMTPTWHEWTFAPVNGGYAQLVSDIAMAQATLRVQAGGKYGPTPSFADEFRYTRIYEAELILDGLPTGAPPCRLFPRADGLGVGGGRRFPPPKSQQRSGRRFGYY